MLPVYEAYFKELYEMYGDLQKAIEGLPTEALDWTPGPEMNSIAVLIAHMTGAQRFLVGDLLGDIPSYRDRPAEFKTHGLDGAALRAMMSQALETTNAALEKLTLADVNATQPRTKNGRSFTVAAALNHALAHTGVHLGHIELTRQLWEQRT